MRNFQKKKKTIFQLFFYEVFDRFWFGCSFVKEVKVVNVLGVMNFMNLTFASQTHPNFSDQYSDSSRTNGSGSMFLGVCPKINWDISIIMLDRIKQNYSVCIWIINHKCISNLSTHLEPFWLVPESLKPVPGVSVGDQNLLSTNHIMRS